MDPVSLAQQEFRRAETALADDNCVAALAHLEKALRLEDNPSWHSYLGYCIARERGQVRKGIEFCLAAISREQDNPVHFLNLGKIQLLAGCKEEALKAFRDGMARGGSEEIVRRLNEIGLRKRPLFPRLPRSHPLNRYLGLLLGRLGLR